MEIYKNHISVKNIYYMLSYAFRTLNDFSIKESSVEGFDDMLNLMAEILKKGIQFQLKKGLLHEYEYIEEETANIRGRIMIDTTLKSGALARKKLVCGFDEFTENTLFNQIIKSTIHYLLSSEIEDRRKIDLKKLYLFFNNVSLIPDIRQIRWSNIRFHRNNAHYELIINICNIILTSMLYTTDEGKIKLRHYCDEQKLHHLYEKFILEYYKKHFSYLVPSSPEIKWALSGEKDKYLPKMQSDVVLKTQDKALIIDAKFYSVITQNRFDKMTYRNGNLYQLFAYVKNEEANSKRKVQGLLLYAKTDEELPECSHYNICGNDIGIELLDLSGNFENIKKKLDNIAIKFLE